ncbi:MAG: YfcE family phosphodiesterase [Methanomassiliicoccales archaeon]
MPENLCTYGRIVTAQRLEALLSEVEGVRNGEDVEYVHRMRVASRRLRSALRIFGECFKGKREKRWRRAVKQVTTSLGEARDLDVQMDLLGSIGKSWEGEEAIGLALVIESLRCRRTSLQPEVVALMDAVVGDGEFQEMRSELAAPVEWKGDPPILYPYAFAHAAVAVEELMEHSHSVPVYEDWQGHHALRIAGKHLRYALEAFREAYPDGLDNDLKALKKLQDTVGELHDCDVWLQRLPGLREEAPSALKAIDRLQITFESRRRERHAKLVEQWFAMLQERFLFRLLDKLKGRPLVETCPVKVALISDAHGNVSALRAVMEHARANGATAFLNAGDAVGLPHPMETIQMLRDKDVLSVVGNIDRAALKIASGKKVKDRQWELATEMLGKDELEWLGSLPDELRLDICGRTVLVTHASPGEEAEKLTPSTPETRLRHLAEGGRADVIVTGHSHVPMVRECAGTVFVNPGSVGRPRDGADASYALLDFPSMDVKLIRVPYDAQGAADELRAQGFKDLPKDVEKGRTADKVRDAAAWAEHFRIDRDHAEQVRTLAALIFDNTRGMHRLDPKDRELLEMAAMVHDVGLNEGAEGHQRRALDIVMNSDLPLDEVEKRMLACIARYHGLRSPRCDDRVFKGLTRSERKRVTKIYSHAGLGGRPRSQPRLPGGRDGGDGGQKGREDKDHRTGGPLIGEGMGLPQGRSVRPRLRPGGDHLWLSRKKEKWYRSWTSAPTPYGCWWCASIPTAPTRSSASRRRW